MKKANKVIPVTLSQSELQVLTIILRDATVDINPIRFEYEVEETRSLYEKISNAYHEVRKTGD